MKKPAKQNQAKDINEEVSEQRPSAIQLFESLSHEEQDQILKKIISSGGAARLTEILRAMDTPGALELFLDRVGYYHFFRMVKD